MDSWSDDDDDAVVGENEGRSGTRPYLVNPLNWGRPDVDYERLFGTDIDLDTAMMKVWRVFYFGLEEVAEKNWGQFHTKDCYLILWISDISAKLAVSIHHWIGRESTADKWGCAAMYAVMLNTFLGGSCTVHREEEEDETSAFVSYFGRDLEYLYGGTESGFLPIEEIKYEPRLYQLQRVVGRRRNRYYARRVALSGDSLTQSEVFVLDNKERLFLWYGSKADQVHRHNGLEFATKIKNFDHQCKSRIIILEEGQEGVDTNLNYEWDLFWRYMGGRVNLQPSDRKFEFVLIEDEDLVNLPASVATITLVGSWDSSVPVPLLPAPNEPGIWEAFVPISRFGSFTYQYKVRLSNGQTELRTDSDRVTVTDKQGVLHNRLRVTDQVVSRLMFFQTDIVDGKAKLLPIRQVSHRALARDHCFILDAETEVFVWLGRTSSRIERAVGKAVGNILLQRPFAFEGKRAARPSWASVTVVFQSAEPLAFRSKFPEWIDTPRPPRDVSKPYVNPYHQPLAELLPYSTDPIDVLDGPVCIDATETFTEAQNAFMQLALQSALAEQAAGASDDDESTKKSSTQVMLLNKPQGPSFDKLPSTEIGQFHTGNCYMVLHTFYPSNGNGKPKAIAYFWQGRAAANGRIHWWARWYLGFFPLLKKKMGKRNVTAILVKEQCEPEHFMSLFPGGVLTIKLGARSAMRRRTLRKVTLLDVRQTAAKRTHAIEVEADSKSLHSRSSFVLQVPRMIMVWHGKASLVSDQDAALKLGKQLAGGRPVKEIDEDDEPDEWFDVLDEHPYARAVEANGMFKLDPVLFSCTCALGEFEVLKIGGFHQAALQSSGVYLLDANRDVFLWYGRDSSETLRRLALKWANEFVDFLCEERSVDLFVDVVEEGKESKAFTQYAHAWLEKVGGVDEETWVDPMVVTRERIEELQRQLYLVEWQEKKETRKQLQLLRIRNSVAFHRVDFTAELAANGIHLRAPTAVVDSTPSAELPAGWTQFRFDADSIDEVPLAVTLYGSWDNYTGKTMAKRGTAWYCALDLVVGRYYYRYEIATLEALFYHCDSDNPVITRASSPDNSNKNSSAASASAEDGAEQQEQQPPQPPQDDRWNSLNIRPSMRPLGQQELEDLRRREREEQNSFNFLSLQEEEAAEAERQRQEEEERRLAAERSEAEKNREIVEIERTIEQRKKEREAAEAERKIRLEMARKNRKAGDESAGTVVDRQMGKAKTTSDRTLEELEARSARRRQRALEPEAPVEAPPAVDQLEEISARRAARRAAAAGDSAAAVAESIELPDIDSLTSRRARRSEPEGSGDVAGRRARREDTSASAATSSGDADDELAALERRRQERLARRARD